MQRRISANFCLFKETCCEPEYLNVKFGTIVLVALTDALTPEKTPLVTLVRPFQEFAARETSAALSCWPVP